MKLLVLLTMLFMSQAYAQETVELTESFFRNVQPESTPQLQYIRANAKQIESQSLMTKDKYNPYLTINSTKSNSQEVGLSANLPVTSDYFKSSFGVQKKTKYGMSVSTEYFYEKSTNTYLTNATESGVNLTLQMSLLNDLMGKVSKAELGQASADKKSAELNQVIQEKQFINNLRKVYWGLVAGQESIKLTENLLLTSEKLLKDTQNKYNSGVATKGDVARVQALVFDRKTRLLELRSSQSQTLFQLKEMLPQLKGKKIIIPEANINRSVTQFFQCTEVIEKNVQTPMNYTLYDDILTLKSNSYNSQKRVIDSYGRADLTLTATAGVMGNDFNFDDANDELSKGLNPSQSLSLQFSMPLGGDTKKTRQSQHIAAKAKYNAEQYEINTRLHAYHNAALENLKLLKLIIANKEQNHEKLQLMFKDSTKKYKQARISTKNLIDDQEQQMNNALTLIQVQTEIIGVMLDYFSVFTETPCDLNRI